MRRFRRLLGGSLLALAGVVGAVAGEPSFGSGLVWSAPSQTLRPPPGSSVAVFTFAVENRSAAPVEVGQITPSCGCTTVEVPASPWILDAGARGQFQAFVDFAGKQGRFSKTIAVQSTAGAQLLTVTIELAEGGDEARSRNQAIAAANRQSVFRGDCATCHAAPLAGLTGRPLFLAACGICHEAEGRAAMVPDLRMARAPRDDGYWRRWISEGKPGTLMPGFGAAQGGPLSAAQIEDLIAHALAELPRGPAVP